MYNKYCIGLLSQIKIYNWVDLLFVYLELREGRKTFLIINSNVIYY